MSNSSDGLVRAAVYVACPPLAILELLSDPPEPTPQERIADALEEIAESKRSK